MSKLDPRISKVSKSNLYEKSQSSVAVGVGVAATLVVVVVGGSGVVVVGGSTVVEDGARDEDEVVDVKNADIILTVDETLDGVGKIKSDGEAVESSALARSADESPSSLNGIAEKVAALSDVVGMEWLKPEMKRESFIDWLTKVVAAPWETVEVFNVVGTGAVLEVR